MVSEVFNRLQAALPEGTPLFLGRYHLTEHATPPRLVLAPVADTYMPGEGGSLAGIEAEFEIAVWGRSYDEVEGAVDELATAFDMAFGSAATLRVGSWEAPEERVMELGVLYRLRFVMRGTVQRTESTAVLETIAQACEGTF